MNEEQKRVGHEIFEILNESNLYAADKIAVLETIKLQIWDSTK